MLVSASDLHVSMDGSTILKALDFDLEAGQWHGLLGPNGSGKTTLLRALAGLIPYTGSLQFEGKEVSVWW
ncbi:MAG: ATP-binding cassette domain-containing protein, partial [Rhodothermales bacterium]